MSGASRQFVRQAIADYLTKGIDQGSIEFLSTVYQHAPKLANENDFYSAQIPGTGSGAVIFIFIGPTTRQRTSPGARAANNTYGGWKWIEYQIGLMCYLRSVKPEAEEAGQDNDAFLDSLIDWIQADRNLGTAPETVLTGAAVPLGAIFQAGEGGLTPGQTDLTVHSLLPKVNKMATLTTFTSVDMKVCQQDQT